MCEMIFEVQGKTDNYVRLKKDGIGIKFLGNNNLRQVPNIKIILLMFYRNITNSTLRLDFG